MKGFSLVVNDGKYEVTIWIGEYAGEDMVWKNAIEKKEFVSMDEAINWAGEQVNEE